VVKREMTKFKKKKEPKVKDWFKKEIWKLKIRWTEKI
jgi:hypothetical protein